MSHSTNSPPGSDWATQTTDTIVRVVGDVRAKTVGPVQAIARVVVYGLLAAIVGVAALVLIAITLIRILDLLPGGVWVAYLITGVLFIAAGLVAWRQRGAPEPA